MIDVTPHLVDLAYDSALKSFWRRKALRGFLLHCGVSDRFLATWKEDESKRDLLDRLFAELRASDKGREGLLKMARFLAEQTSFPDLRNWEDSDQKLRDAAEAVERLHKYLEDQAAEFQRRRDRAESEKRNRAAEGKTRRADTALATLKDRFDGLCKELGTAQAGYDFQAWFYDLMDFSEIDNRRPYQHAGRQIDGSITLSSTTYLVELKFTAEQADVTEIDSFFKKVSEKADNTMGVMVSVSGYSSVAIRGASVPRTPLLLLDANHLFFVLLRTMTFAEVVERIRRHASQTSEAYLPAAKFGG